MKYTFKGGPTVEGTLDEIMSVAAALGKTVDLSQLKGVKTTPRGYYNSSSKGLQPINKMNTTHIRNALLKRTREYYADIQYAKVDSKAGRSKFLAAFTSLVNDSQITDLFNELASR